MPMTRARVLPTLASTTTHRVWSMCGLMYNTRDTQITDKVLACTTDRHLAPGHRIRPRCRPLSVVVSAACIEHAVLQWLSRAVFVGAGQKKSSSSASTKTLAKLVQRGKEPR
jgi:hypothetical protein